MLHALFVRGMNTLVRLECDLYRAADLHVTWGIHDGDCLGPPELCAPGDMYMLDRRAVAIPATIEIADTITLLPDGTSVTPLGALRLMAGDGDQVEVLVLDCAGDLYALPLSPMRAALAYALIETSTQDPALRLTQVVHGAFAHGTRIALADGSLRPIETLTPGDMILTRDAGHQPLRWRGTTTLRAFGSFAPVTFAPGTLGNLGPLTLAPLQRIFLYQRGERVLGDQAEMLIQAQFLTDGARVTRREGGFVTYHALAFDAHQIVYAEGVPVESLLVSRATLARLPEALASDLKARFPKLDQSAHFARDVRPEQIAAKISHRP